MSYKPLDTRQVINRSALSNIGSPVNTSLDVILADINAALSGVSGSKSYTAQAVTLTTGMGTTSYVATIPAMVDLSYVVFAVFENTVDSFPQFQQIEVTNKGLDRFTFQWNSPLESNNYVIDFIIPPITAVIGEVAIPDSSLSVTATLGIPQNGSSYGVIATLQNLVDPFPQFQTPILTNQTSSGFTDEFNTETSSSNYQMVYTTQATAQVAIPMGATSVTVNLPVSYGSTGYSSIASLVDMVDTFPMYQPIIVTGKSSTQVTFSWNSPTQTASTALTYLALSSTPT